MPGYGGYQQPQPQPQQGYNQYVNPMYSTTAPMAANQMNQPYQQQQKQANMGITLDTGKKEDEFGNFASSNLGTAQDVS